MSNIFQKIFIHKVQGVIHIFLTGCGKRGAAFSTVCQDDTPKKKAAGYFLFITTRQATMPASAIIKSQLSKGESVGVIFIYPFQK